MRRALALCAVLCLLLSVPALALTEEEKEAAALEAGRAAVAACTEEGMTDLEKLTALHDWLDLHCDYAAAPDSKTAYGSLVRGQAVCVGYAEGMALLARLAGLDGAATYSGEIDHAWILATLEGDRYYCDCTWDDGKYEKLGLIRHRYFLFNEANAADTGHIGWDSPERVPGGPLEGVPWRLAVTRVIFSGEWAYYIDREGWLTRCGRSGWNTERLLRLEETWPAQEDRDPELLTGLVLIGDRLYFNTTSEVRSVDLTGGDLRTEFTPDPSAGLVMGIGVREGRLCCSQAAAPGEPVYDVIDTGIDARRAWGCSYEAQLARLRITEAARRFLGGEENA